VAGWLRAAERVGEQAPDLGDGERDEAGVGRRPGVQAGGWRGLGIGPVPEPGGGDGAHRKDGYD
jgi:hypothetical protein